MDIARIDDAPLSAPAYRTARRLLDRARNGVTRCTHEELRAIVGGEDGTARNHLHQLHAAGLIVYRRNAAVGKAPGITGPLSFTVLGLILVLLEIESFSVCFSL